MRMMGRRGTYVRRKLCKEEGKVLLKEGGGFDESVVSRECEGRRIIEDEGQKKGMDVDIRLITYYL